MSKHSNNQCLVSVGNILCWSCNNKLTNTNMPALSFMNKMDPGEVSWQLKDLSLVEKQLISQVNVFFTLLLLPGKPGGQLAQRGFAIHFPLDTATFTTELPRALKDNHYICTVSTSSKTNRQRLFNASRVKNALEWLIDNNRLYSDVKLLDVLNDTSEESTTNITESGVIMCDYEQQNIFSSPEKAIYLIDDKSQPIDFFKYKFIEQLTFP